MRLLPFEKVTIETSLSKEETLAELIKSIDQDRYPKPWRKGDPREFEGYLGRDEFRISRIANFEHPLLPIVEGRVETHESKTSLVLQLKVDRLSFGFLLSWCGLFGMILLLQLSNRVDSDGSVINTLIMFAAGYLGIMFFYWFEAKAAKDLLCRICHGGIVRP